MLQTSFLNEKRMGQNIPANFASTHMNPCWYPFNQDADYFNLLPFDENGQALIIEDLSANSAWGSWHLINGIIKKGDDPTRVAQSKLMKITGHRSDNWLYLGSFMLNPNKPDVNGHFYAALGTQLVEEKHFINTQECSIKWVSAKDLRYALLDGRIGMMSYAVTTSLALLLSPNGATFPMIR